MAEVLKERKNSKCKICNASFANLNRHHAAVHEGKKPFECNICMQKFPSQSNMTRHIASVHEEKKSSKCEICEYHYSAKHHLNEHIASVHEGKKPFQSFECKVCDYKR